MKNTLFARQKSAMNSPVQSKLNINVLMTISWDLRVLQIVDQVIKIISVLICSVVMFLMVQRLQHGLTHRTMFYLMFQSQGVNQFEFRKISKITKITHRVNFGIDRKIRGTTLIMILMFFYENTPKSKISKFTEFTLGVNHFERKKIMRKSWDFDLMNFRLNSVNFKILNLGVFLRKS